MTVISPASAPVRSRRSRAGMVDHLIHPFGATVRVLMGHGFGGQVFGVQGSGFGDRCRARRFYGLGLRA